MLTNDVTHSHSLVIKLRTGSITAIDDYTHEVIIKLLNDCQKRQVTTYEFEFETTVNKYVKPCRPSDVHFLLSPHDQQLEARTKPAN